MTRSQARLLAFIKSFSAESGGVMPSLDEMKDELGLHSKNGVSRILKALVERGLIRRRKYRARGIELVEQTPFLTREALLELLAYTEATGRLMTEVIGAALSDYYRAYPADGEKP
jgi:repressor LexA